MKVLVVDDAQMNLMLAKKLLETLDVECDTASSGTEAIGKITYIKYNLVLMDHLMPEMDGVETTKKLREKGYTPEKLPVILFTANDIDEIQEMIADAQFNDYLPKPLNRVSLEDMLKKWQNGGKVKNKPAVNAPDSEKVHCEKIIKAIREIEEIDVESALERVGGDNSILESSLKIMTRGLPEVIEKLNKSFYSGDIANFTIEVHGVKGTLLNIGANGLAEIAGELEKRSRAEDLNFCKQNIHLLNDQLLTLHEKLSKIMDNQSDSSQPKKKGNTGTLKKQIKKLKQYIDDFKGDEAVKLIESMLIYTYSEDTDLFLQKLMRLIEEFQYEQALELIAREKI